MKELSRNKLAVIGVVLIILEALIAIFAPLIAPYDPLEMNLAETFMKPCAKHLFGTDDVGRDLLSRIIYGARYSLSTGVLAMIFGVVCGLLVGSIAGYAGGQVDNIIMRILDVIQALPGMLLLIVLASMLGGGFLNTVIAMGVGAIAGNARLIRAQIMKEKSAEYIEACDSINCSKFRIVMKHLLPNTISPIIVSASMSIGNYVVLGSSMSFIGLGVQPPTPEWGALLSDARSYIASYPHLVMFPGMAIAITVLAFNLLGDGLRDAMDPKLKH
ncbi:MAG: ABC transporter permease [Lachnospiraceae bacterium]|nr:ABC transporter permease [Lachnospiraceae bacterium]